MGLGGASSPMVAEAGLMCSMREILVASIEVDVIQEETIARGRCDLRLNLFGREAQHVGLRIQ